MVLAVSNSDHTKVELIQPSSPCIIGEKIIFEGYSGEPDLILNPKQKIWEQIQPVFYFIYENKYFFFLGFTYKFRMYCNV